MDFSQSRKILYVTHRVPYPPDKGDRIRTYHTLRFLAQHHDVYLACLADELVSEDARRELEGICERVAIVPLRSMFRKPRMAVSLMTGGSASLAAFRSKSLTRILDTWLWEINFDLALASASSVAPYLLQAVKNRGVSAFIDLMDVDSEKWFNYAAASSIPMKWVYQREGAALRRYEKEISSWAEAVLLVSEAEAQLFRSIASDANVHAISNGVDLDYFQPATVPIRNHSCVFVGALDYQPNIDAVCWFAKTIWPEVRKKHPQASFQIVGRRPVAAVTNLSHISGIEVVGQVPDVRPYVHTSCLVVAPLRIARGLQNKVLEAMAMGKPVVASPAALAGLHPNLENPAERAETRDDWIKGLDRLYASQQTCDELGLRGRHYVEKHYDWNRCLEPLQKLIQSLPVASGNKLPSGTRQVATV